ncbi:MAG: GNAT family N-acetyltransferase [Nocardioidaceae bacterium]
MGTPSDDIRVGPATDAARYLATDLLVWFSEETTWEPAQELEGVPEEQRFAAEVEGADPATYPGIYGVRPLLLTVPGGRAAPRQLPVAGLAWVGVHPDHRRRGVLRAMMRDHLERTASAGVPVSVLHASESEIYGRYGYGLAGHEISLSLARGTTFQAPHLEAEAARIRTRMVTLTSPGVADRVRESDLVVGRTEVGTLVFDEGFYRRSARPNPAQVRDKEPWRILFATLDGADVGSAVFRRTEKWEQGRPGGEVRVQVLYGGPAARLALLRRLVDLDLMGTVRLPQVGPDDPLWHWLPGPRSVSDAHPLDNVWVRLVDLPAALAARGYEEDCDVVVAVADELLPANAGTWRIRVVGGEASVVRSDGEPDVRLDVARLGAAWLGWGNLVAMQRAGVVAEERPGALRELWRAFRTDVSAWPSPGF